ncbi:hypothetical protein COLO4_34838 [Corchorus olitorius]|uniref:Uncharacterized protein n=1 Tax=Corchorus olitorius TaxID=93759 RepID=A0A1R3GJG6_9ROSI|nr:hypothetical protein COLO4_34838 [Corchorus olitorius]
MEVESKGRWRVLTVTERDGREVALLLQSIESEGGHVWP